MCVVMNLQVDNRLTSIFVYQLKQTTKVATRRRNWTKVWTIISMYSLNYEKRLYKYYFVLLLADGVRRKMEEKNKTPVEVIVEGNYVKLKFRKRVETSITLAVLSCSL